MKKFNRKLTNNTALGMTLLVLTNIVLIALSVLVSRYIKIYPKYFIIGLSSALIFVLLINLSFVFGYYFKKITFRRIMIFLSVSFILIGGILTFYLYKTSSLIDQMIDLDGNENVEFVLVSLDSETSLETLDGKNVAYIPYNDEFDAFLEGSLEESNLNVELVKYNNLSSMVLAVADGQEKFVVLPKEYRKLVEAFGLEVNPFESAEVLLSMNSNVNDDASLVDVSEDPFTILLMGNNESLTDSIILVSYNPKLQNVTMTSIPRDSYVPIACQNNRYDKVNHSRAISRKCFIDTIENYIDVEVDFFFEADFYAIVKIVDALGGLEITSPVSFAGSLLEENKDTYKNVHVPEGTNILNGEQVLTFARERNHMPRGDYDRQMNQQYVIKQIVTKIIATRNPNKLIEVLDAAKDNIVTNLSMDSITGLMGHAIEVIGTSPLSPMDAFRIESTQILGASDTTSSGMWIMRPYQNDVRNATILISNNLKTELELGEFKTFAFGYRNPYIYAQDYDIFNVPSETLWRFNGSSGPSFEDSNTNTNESNESNESDQDGSSQDTPIEQEPSDENQDQNVSSKVEVIDFSQMSDQAINEWASKSEISVKFSYYETSSSDFKEGQFWYQSVGAGTLIEKNSTIEIVRVKIILDTNQEGSGSQSSEDTAGTSE